MKTIIIGLPLESAPLARGDGIMDVETCYRGGSPIYQTKLLDELAEYTGQRVIVTIETLIGRECDYPNKFEIGAQY